MRSGALEGFEVHPRGLGSVGSKRERTNGVVAKEESTEHWTHAAIRTYCPDFHLEEFGVVCYGIHVVCSRPISWLTKALFDPALMNDTTSDNPSFCLNLQVLHVMKMNTKMEQMIGGR
eukprot:scaffold7783_cov85-Skeletonema_dohrnii-CCMP3373.AAC.5